MPRTFQPVLTCACKLYLLAIVNSRPCAILPRTLHAQDSKASRIRVSGEYHDFRCLGYCKCMRRHARSEELRSSPAAMANLASYLRRSSEPKKSFPPLDWDLCKTVVIDLEASPRAEAGQTPKNKQSLRHVWSTDLRHRYLGHLDGIRFPRWAWLGRRGRLSLPQRGRRRLAAGRCRNYRYKSSSRRIEDKRKRGANRQEGIGELI